MRTSPAATDLGPTVTDLRPVSPGPAAPRGWTKDASPPVTLRFTQDPSDRCAADVVAVLDTTWTPRPGTGDGDAPPIVSVRDVAAAILAEHDLLVETSNRLDAWAASSGVIERLTIRETSFWFYVRLRHWSWLEDRILWAAIADRLVTTHRPARIACAPGGDPALLDVLRLIVARDSIELDVETAEPERSDPGPAGSTVASAARPSTLASAAGRPVARPAGPRPVGPSGPGTLRRLVRRVRRRVLGAPRPSQSPSPEVRRRQELAARVQRVRSLVDALAAEPERRLLVVHEHARQRVETPDGPRSMNPYLDPIVDRLRGTRLEPIVLDIRARVADDVGWERIGGGAEPRLLPVDALAAEPLAVPPASARSAPARPAPARSSDNARSAASAASTSPTAAPAAGGPPGRTEPGGRSRVAPDGSTAGGMDPALVAWRDAVASPIPTSGIDLGPLLAAEVAATASRFLPGMATSIDRIGRFLERLRPAGIVLADEYHRQDWMAAARSVGIPVAAVQHGMIYPRHNGYIHAARPEALRLPDRTFVFGRWERDLLRTRSVYRDDEVTVGGSPRLDLVHIDRRDGARVRRDLGVGDGERLVVISGTWGGIYRRFHYPIALAALVDRPLPGVHFVIKLHPGEPDEGPYRRILEDAAAARGIAPPPVTAVQAIDLYRLLAAADAHLGIHSTVLTEAVVTRTPNLLAEGLLGADLLGYVPAGVARAVRNGGDLLAALDPNAGPAMTDADAIAFQTAHFEPGDASERIATDLMAWLS